jgi:hypothetical protein
MIAAWIASVRHRPAVKTAVAWFGVVALGGLFAVVWDRASRPGGYDVHCFLTTARTVRAGDNPYLAETFIPYNYPLLACTAAVPLTFLPEPVVHVGWFLATLAAWTAVAFLLVNRLRPVTGIGWDGGLLLPFVLAVVLIYGAVQNHLFNGQTDAFVLLLCVLFWIDWEEERGGRAAFWLGAAVSLKLVPALFFVPLVMRGAWPVLARTGFWIVVLSVALPMLFLGTGVFTAYEHFARTVLFPELHSAAHSVQYPHCYTLHGVLVWLVPAWKTSLPARAAAVLLVVLPLCVMERRAAGFSPWRHFARLEACLAAILLLAPLSQPHHLTLLLPGVLLMGLRWQTVPDRPLWRELLELLPFGLVPVWDMLGGPFESLFVLWLYVAALARATFVREPCPRPLLSRRIAETGMARLVAGAPQAERVGRTRTAGRPNAASPVPVP